MYALCIMHNFGITDERKNHIADMICFTSYKDLDLDEDPILVLPCGHFFTVSSLDGLFGIQQAYEVDPHGNFTGLKSLLDNCQDIKPKTCPDCRSIVHSVKRYGRLLSFVRLRILERKHIIARYARIPYKAGILINIGFIL